MAGGLSIMSGRAVLKRSPKCNDLGERVIAKLCKVCRNPHRQRYENLLGAGFTCHDLSKQARLYKVRALMQTGLYPPNPVGYWCSERWCGHQEMCKREFTVR